MSSDEDMKKSARSLIEKSGMLTHLKVIDILKKSGWSVRVSPYYYDDVAESVREIDIVAEKPFNSAEQRYISTTQLNVQLFVECKYINQDVLLWFDKPNQEKAVEALEKATGLQLAVRHSGDVLPDSFRYYTAEKVAKIFSGNSGREDLIYKALSQSLRALVYYKQWAPGPIENSFNDHPESVNHVVRYPVVVCDNFQNLKELRIGTDSGNLDVSELKGDFLLETNYVYFNKAKTTTIDDYFWIDFVDANKLGQFLQILESEAAAILRAQSFIQDIRRSRQQEQQRERRNPAV